MRRVVASLAGLGLLVAAVAPRALWAAEIAATHLVYEKATKMKKAAAELFVSLPDPADGGDALGRERRLRCAALAWGKTGPLEVRGEFLVSLLGRHGGSGSAWESTALGSGVDPFGEAAFDAEALAGLVAEAEAAGAEPAGIRIEFDGGKGKKVSRLTVDCVHERTGG